MKNYKDTFNFGFTVIWKFELIGDQMQQSEDEDEVQKLGRLRSRGRQVRFHAESQIFGIREAFQKHNNRVLDVNYYVSYRAYEVGWCLDECLRDRDV